jgi:hypothetical protein
MTLYIIAACGRTLYARQAKKIQVEKSFKTKREYFNLFLSSFMMIIPLIYVFSPWLENAVLKTEHLV